MSEYRLRVAAWVAAGLSIAVAFDGLALALGDDRSDIPSPTLIGATNGVFLVVIALVIVDHQPRQAVGWTLGISGAGLAASGLLVALADRSVSASADNLEWVALVAGSVAFAMGAVTFLVFPTGAIATGRWARALTRALLALLALALVVGAVAGWTIRGPVLWGYMVDDVVPESVPVGLDIVFVVNQIASFAWLVGLVSILVRYVRASGERRQQLAWAVLGIATTVVLLVPGYALLGPGVQYVAAIPLVTGLMVAMRRSSLFGADAIVRVAARYGLLSVMLAAVYVVVVVAVGAAADAVGARSSVPVAVATLAAALAFAPLRHVAQRGIDRGFDRRGWEAVRRVDAAARRLRDGEIDAAEMEEELRVAVGDPSLSVTYVLPSGERVDHRGASVPVPVDDTPASPHRVVRGVEIAGRRVAEVDLDGAVAAAEPALVTAALAAGALCMENGGLRAGAAAQLSEVERSRSRLAAASESERRRIERDLHDGAQQRLVALALRLRMIQRRSFDDLEGASEELDRAVDEVHRVIDDLRALTQGLLPAVLHDEGLAVALRTIAAELPVPVDLDVIDGRLPVEVESATWFFVCEGLTNAMKHAAPTRVLVTIARTGDRLAVEVRDDGRGGARERDGGGLQGLRDRVAAIGGVIDVSAGRPGTVLRAELPCAS